MSSSTAGLITILATTRMRMTLRPTSMTRMTTAKAAAMPTTAIATETVTTRMTVMRQW